MLNSEQEDEECDATKMIREPNDDKIKILTILLKTLSAGKNFLPTFVQIWFRQLAD